MQIYSILHEAIIDFLTIIKKTVDYYCCYNVADNFDLCFHAFGFNSGFRQ